MRTSPSRRRLLAPALTAALAATLASGALASADPLAEDGVTLTVDIQEAGALFMSVDTSAPVALTEDGTEEEVRQFTGTLPTVTVTDTRSESPEGAYWSVIGNTGDFVEVADPAQTISGTYLGWTPALVEVPDGDDQVAPGMEVDSEADGGTGVVGGYDLLVGAFESEGAREYGSEWKANADLSLRIPAEEALSGSYAATMTLSLFEDVP